MSLITDKEIIDLAEKGMITPFISKQVRWNNHEGGHKIISQGLSSSGYDVTLSPDKAVILSIHPDKWPNIVNEDTELDPLNFNEDTMVELELQTDEITGNKYFVMPPHSFMLGFTKEVFKIPRNITSVCVGKSTYARCGIIVNVTPIEPGFEGQVVLEFSNTTPFHCRIYADQGACQFQFFKHDDVDVSYGDRNGKYQGQRGITTARG